MAASVTGWFMTRNAGSSLTDSPWQFIGREFSALLEMNHGVRCVRRMDDQVPRFGDRKWSSFLDAGGLTRTSSRCYDEKAAVRSPETRLVGSRVRVIFPRGRAHP